MSTIPNSTTKRPKRSVQIRLMKESSKTGRETGPLPSTPVTPYVPVPNERTARIAFRNAEREEREYRKRHGGSA